ncbi:hypothetical protein C8J56DRAFT_927475 [Mycena floridula]|nr:hypothetical protein C8J56DRAFT_927475 [Mycena floridula]
MSLKGKDTKPLALADTLRDLALLRAASDIDLSALLPHSVSNSHIESDVEKSMQMSYEFAKEARSALKIYNRNTVDEQGNRVESVRTKLDEALSGLETK